MTPLGRVINVATGQTVIARLYVADRFLSRLLGLQFRRPLPAGEGLLLAPCRSVHTFCVRFVLDLACLDSQGMVVETRTGVRPWRVVMGPPTTMGILEASAGQLRKIRVGDRLSFVPDRPGTRLPTRLKFLARS
jgi:uncharacterized membrane protein (UPF0127 family)